MYNNVMLKPIIISITITLLLSLGAGFVLKDILGFWQGFVSAVIVQFVASYIFNILKKEPIITQSDDDASRLIEMQTTLIECPCGRNSFAAPIFLNFENLFLCDKCGSKFRVELNYDSILVTEPLNIENAYNALKSKELS